MAQDIFIRMTSFQAKQNFSAQKSQGLLSSPCDMQLQVLNLAQPARNLFKRICFISHYLEMHDKCFIAD